ncbi:MAG: acyl-CoA dehydrogenase [Comamonadaceae bacterium]|nr:MAG: acyl-CoA dehydrogenase [Comamonadaceae bacterium]
MNQTTPQPASFKTAEALENWIGRRQTVTDTINAVQARQMAATMDDRARMNDPALSPLPAGWHWLYFNPMEVHSRLGEDGHPARGDFLPPVELPRRMWAGSRLEWQRAFTVGAQVDKNTEIVKLSRKSGRTGDMVFVTLAHVYSDADGVLLREEHDIVYRGLPSEAEKAALAEVPQRATAWLAAPPAFEREGTQLKPVHADPVMLYRYSAATFNGHRIHYDIDYCRNVEGYPGLVVHGPLLATLLLSFIENEVAPGRRIRTFEFRAMRPTFCLGGGSGFHLHASAPDTDGALQVWSTNNAGQVGVDGRITLA